MAIFVAMRTLYFIAFIFLISSCSVEKRLEKYCPLCTQKDSTVTVIEYRDTTINIPGETVFIEDTLFCDSLGNVYASRLSEKDGTIIKLQSRIRNNKYNVTATVDTIYKVVKGNTVYNTKVVTKTQKPERIKYIPWWVNFFAVIGGIVFIIFIIYLIIKIVKKSIIPIS
jgi:hypothetical protein